MAVHFLKEPNHIIDYIQVAVRFFKLSHHHSHNILKDQFGDLCLTGANSDSLTTCSFIVAAFSPMLSLILKDSPGCNQIILPDFGIDCLVNMLNLAYTGT